jgi:putative spermidine/putrescine transport system permease protein
VAPVRRSLGWEAFRYVWLALFGIFFFLPLLAMLDFSTRVVGSADRTLKPWRNLFTDVTISSSIVTSLLLAVLTTVLMLVLLTPTMIWVRLRVPGAAKLVEYLCLLPLTIPPLVIVVGISNVYAWVTYLFGDSALTLTFAYVVLVLPYAYRSVDGSLAAINVLTLSEAARSLGAGWGTVIVRVVLPNIWPGVASAAFVSVALVLGEFTFASLLNFTTLPTVLGLLNKSDAPTGVAGALGSLVLASLLLVLLSFTGRRTRAPKGA